MSALSAPIARAKDQSTTSQASHSRLHDHAVVAGRDTGYQSPVRKASPARQHGASPVFYKSPHARSFKVIAGKHAVAYSDGGGLRVKLKDDTPFPGRLASGGTRSQVFGTSRYGSGYPYGASGSYLTGRPFPFLFYPIVLTTYNYYGSEEYKAISAAARSGGDVKTVVVHSSDSTSNATYRIIGDNRSVLAVYAAVVANCSAVDVSTVTSFLPSSEQGPQPEQVIQWYRASSFALSLDGYNNAAALLANMPASGTEAVPVLSADTPLPSWLNETFLTCVNLTIGASVPLSIAGERDYSWVVDVLPFAIVVVTVVLWVIAQLVWSACLWVVVLCCGRAWVAERFDWSVTGQITRSSRAFVGCMRSAQRKARAVEQVQYIPLP